VEERLNKKGYVVGLDMGCCVKETAFDAKRLGFRVSSSGG
jgi:nicotinamidase-related amidase